MGAITRPAADGARELALLLRDCVASGVARRALLLRLSLLPADCLRPGHLRLAREALAPLLAADRARLFTLPGGDLVVVWRGEAGAALEQGCTALLRLFEDAIAEPAALLLPLALPRQAGILLDEVARPRPDTPPPAPAPDPPLDAAGMAALERAIAQADLAGFVRRRPVLRIDPGGGRTLAWDKRVFSISALAATLSPGADPRGDPALFQRLSVSLDRRMLALLAMHGELAQAGAFAIDLNVASILGPEFLRLDAALPARLRGQVRLDLLPADVMADPAAFLFARDFALARGFRLGLRAMAPLLLAVLPAERLGVDTLELRHDPGLERIAVDPARLVLAGADTPEALAWGARQGIRLFRGRMARA